MKKTIVKYVIIYLLLLFWNLIIQPYCYDEVWNYGFIYNVSNGLVPYRDFNMVVTPFSSFLYAIPFLIFGHNILVLHIFNAFIVLGIFVILDRLFENKSLSLLALLLFPSATIAPGYNVLLLFLYLLLIYLEKNEKNDYLIGFIIALCFLTKQSVGLLLILPSLVIKDKRKIRNRLIGFIIPCLIFLLYLLITKSFNQFLDLCLFGLFDFASNNREKFKLFLILYLIMIFINIIIIFKDKKNIFNYYCLFYSVIAVPLFDLLHFFYALFAFIILLLLNNSLKIKVNNTMFFIAIYSILGFIFYTTNGKTVYPNDIHNFEYRRYNINFCKFTHEVNDYIRKNQYKEYVFISSEAYYFRIINEERITYLDLMNYGNQGYNGTEKLLKLVKEKEKNAIFFVSKNELINGSQLDKTIMKYVISNAKKIDQVNIYEVYKF